MEQGLSFTINGLFGNGEACGYNSPGGSAASTTLRVTYTLTLPHNRVRGLRLWNQGGGILNDADGLGPFTAEFYSGATLLHTFNTHGANGGGGQTLMFPGGLSLDGVDRVVLRDLGKLSTSGVAPLWQELQLLEAGTVFPCRRSNGNLDWFDVAGAPVPSANIIPCPGTEQPLVVNDLSINGAAFNFAGDGSGTDEGMLLSPAAASTSTGTVQVSPGLYHASAASPPSPCGGRVMNLTYPPGSSFDFAYQAAGAEPVGGVYIQLFAPSLGGALNFGLFSPLFWTPTQTKRLPVPGGWAELTYVSGPAFAGNTNSPFGTDPTCGLGAPGSQVIGLHLGSITTADQPMRFRISFTRGV